jgi:excisionase family DNA binding protein
VPDEEYISVAQAAQCSGLSRRQIQRLLQNGVIPGIKPGHDWLVKLSAVMAYLRGEHKPGPKRTAKD